MSADTQVWLPPRGVCSGPKGKGKPKGRMRLAEPHTLKRMEKAVGVHNAGTRYCPSCGKLWVISRA